MKRQILLFFLLTVSVIGFGQLTFRTVAPQVAVVSGESFEIQYIVEGVENIESFTAPAFTGFNFVTGPHVYKRSVIDLNTAKPLVNTVYTLLAVKPGRYVIHGAKAIVNGTELNSTDIFIEVISRAEALKRNKRSDGSFFNNSEYFLHPGEDPIKKIQQNLFLKVTVDKRNCYVGEPITATYKLYSRLESKSDIVKNPGFYGFAVLDMVNLGDKRKQTETVDGKTFDVHTIRKVQLYPLQAGNYTVDAMEISNKVEFSRSEVNKKTEQEIAEGILRNNDDAVLRNNTEVYENSMKTEDVPVSVKPLPAKSKTDSFTAAVGNFSIKAELKKGEVAKNEQDSMLITVTGEGNFPQITPPVIDWPEGIDVFEPVIEDSIDRLHVPLKGTKTFRYSFVSSKPGSYEIPSLSFPFFNPDSGKFHNVSTEPLKVVVSNAEKVKEKLTVEEKPARKFPVTYQWLLAVVVLALLALAFYFIKTRKRPINEEVVIVKEEKPTIDSFLQPAEMMLVADDSKFYNELNKSIWSYFHYKTNFTGSEMSKTGLISFLQSSGIDSDTANDLLSVLQLCEAGIYTTALHADDKKEVLDKTRKLLVQIDSKMS